MRRDGLSGRMTQKKERYSTDRQSVSVDSKVVRKPVTTYLYILCETIDVLILYCMFTEDQIFFF